MFENYVSSLADIYKDMQKGYSEWQQHVHNVGKEDIDKGLLLYRKFGNPLRKVWCILSCSVQGSGFRFQVFGITV